MKKSITYVLFSLFFSVMCATLVFAFSGPETVTYAKTCKKGSVIFEHKVHADIVTNSCSNTACHGDKTPVALKINKRTAHGKTCKICHKAEHGPTKCSGCHIKS